MGKPVDPGNSTQQISPSQVLDISAQARPIAKHDQSLWKGVVVGADEFSPVRSNKPSRARRLVIGGVIAAGVAGGGVFAYSKWGGGGGGGGGSGSEAVPAQPHAEAPAPATPAPAVAAPKVQADAAVAVAPPDAAVPAAMMADAISSVGPPIKKASTGKKKKIVKKRH